MTLTVPPRRDSNTDADANTRFSNQDVVKILHSFRDQPHLYEVFVLHDDGDNKHLRVVQKNLLPDSVHVVVDLKSRMGHIQSMEMRLRDTRTGDVPQSLRRADFVEWQAPHVPHSPWQAALMAQLPSSAQAANASGDQPDDAWSLTELQAQLHQIEQQPAMSATSATPGHSPLLQENPWELFTYASNMTRKHIGELASRLGMLEMEIDCLLNEHCQVGNFQGEAENSNLMALTIRKAILAYALTKSDGLNSSWLHRSNLASNLLGANAAFLNIPANGSDSVAVYSGLALLAFQEDLRPYSLEELHSRLHLGEGEISEGGNQRKQKLTYLELFALARHAGVAQSTSSSNRFHFALKESQLIEIATLPDGWRKLDAVFRYQDGIGQQLTTLVNAGRLALDEAEQFLMRYGFNSFFPRNMLATSNVAYTRLEMTAACLITSIQEHCEEEESLSPQDRKNFSEMLSVHLGFLDSKYEELGKKGWNEPMLDYELQPFNFTFKQCTSIFLQNPEHARLNGEALSAHMDWLLKVREALRGRELDERQISEGLGWLANREEISACLSEEYGHRRMKTDRDNMSVYLQQTYFPQFPQ